MKKKLIIMVLIISLIVACFIFFYNKERFNETTNESVLERKDDNMNDFTSKINLNINGNDFTVTLEDNETSRELVNRLPLSITMNELNGNEKYYYFDEDLPSNPVKVDIINKGDVMLYGDNCLVIFYDTFTTSYSYTKIGTIDNPDDLDMVGNNNVIVNITR